MITKKIIEKIEGEAEVFFEKENNTISFATIAFTTLRGFHTILQNKPALDALVFTPRVCGICGHSHLYATTKALEDIYKNANIDFSLSPKAYFTRELTLIAEIIQNHLKWFFLTALPQIQKLQNITAQTNLQGIYASSIAGKIIALFSGQYPHNSYMLPGGITSDFTYIEITKALHFIDELILFFEQHLLGTNIDNFLSFQSCKDFNSYNGLYSFFEKQLIDLQMHKKGFGDDRFLSLGEHLFNTQAKVKKTLLQKAHHKYITIQKPYSPYEKTYAYNALYKEEYIEVGPLARAMANNIPLIKNIHRRYKDSTYTRAIARIHELIALTLKAKEIIQQLDPTQPSFTHLENINKLSGSGVGIVEAPRGTLLHSIKIKNGIIQEYSIITPTQFNLASGTPQKPSIVQKSMQHLTEEEALFVFRTFDVCSVCTTH